MIHDFLIPLAAIGLAELGDKSQMCVLLMSSRTKKRLRLLLGTMAAFLAVDAAAIAAGSLLTSVIPAHAVRLAAAALFVAFGVMTLMEKNVCDVSRLKARGPFMSGFMLIFLTEWGDKTQISSGLLASQYNPFAVLAGTMAGLLIASALAIYLGKCCSDRIGPGALAKISGCAFIAIGVSFLFI